MHLKATYSYLGGTISSFDRDSIRSVGMTDVALHVELGSRGPVMRPLAEVCDLFPLLSGLQRASEGHDQLHDI